MGLAVRGFWLSRRRIAGIGVIVVSSISSTVFQLIPSFWIVGYIFAKYTHIRWINSKRFLALIDLFFFFGLFCFFFFFSCRFILTDRHSVVLPFKFCLLLLLLFLQSDGKGMIKFGSGSYSVRESEGLNPQTLTSPSFRTITCTVFFLDDTERNFEIDVSFPIATE